MSAESRCTKPPAEWTWVVPAQDAARFTWEYDDGRDRLPALYQKGEAERADARRFAEEEGARVAEVTETITQGADT